LPVTWLTEQLYPDDAVLLPLSVGHHVDHVLVRAWGEAAGRSAQAPLSYYEEALYADQHGAQAWASVDIDGLQRLHLALPPSGHALKQRAVAAYASQLMMLGVDPNNLADGEAFMTRLAAEGYWRRLHPGSPAHQHSRRMTIDQDFMRLLDL
jgi:hypothetical protein